MAERKASGGKKKKSRKKRLHEKPGQARVVKLGEKKVKLIKGRGKTRRLVSLSQNVVNVVDKGKAKKALIKNVVETPANRFLARQNILIKGAIVETDIGKARITNRPSQEGFINAVIVEDKE